ncbi:response regulator [Flexithrix dorotheae]|uniref:response regulator n=1 Tax=Flexithrix dorotheae TaxID=70993 RepID=UPI000363DD9B|nr:response regulator [Flexithrix dorotheae]
MNPQILYVDDEQENLDSFQLVFMLDYNIHIAKSAKEGMEILSKNQNSSNKIQLVITDQRMPGISGIEFLDKVNAKFPNVVKILLTGYSDANIVEYAMNKAKVFSYVTKPWDEQQLKKTIDQALQKFQTTAH